MSEQILLILKRKLDDLNSEVDPETHRNILKEELQFYVLSFIYNHLEYGKWIMYGGSALRIIHGLDRMSVDLDFEIAYPVTLKFLDELKKEIEEHFMNTYGAGANFLTIKIITGRSLRLNFHIGEELNLGHSSKQAHVKIDFNYFVAPQNTVTERRPPIDKKSQLSFLILTYNMSALMASKIAAIFLRDQRGVDKSIYDYKGRDIYDLLWYMSKKVIPDFDYLNAKLKEKGVEMRDIKALFNKLTVDILNYEKMDNLLKDDLANLFENPHQFENWFSNWRDEYLRLLDEYKIRTVQTLERAEVFQDIRTDRFNFKYGYRAEDGGLVRIVYALSDYWIDFSDGDLPVEIDKKIGDILEFTGIGSSNRSASRDKLKQYATLFYRKTEVYFKKTNRVMLGDSIITKVIRMTSDKLNYKEQVFLNKDTLLSCELDDLLK